VLLVLCLAFSFALPALADETQAQEGTQMQLSPDLVAQESIRMHVYAPVECAGVVTQVYGGTFTVTKGGKGNQVEKTFTVTSETKIVGVGKLKGSVKIEPGLMVKVKAAGGKALVVRLLPAKKAKAMMKGKAPFKKPGRKTAHRGRV
jgi:hypothetical protein